MKEYIERALAVQELEVLRQEYEMHDDCDELVARRCRDAISALPAADVVEVRHGRWIEDERTYPGPGLKNNLCSVCGEIAGSWKEGLEPGRKWAYCPNCGARMGKEDEHEIG